MLDSKDLELLRAMMQEVVGESEARMTARIDDAIGASEARMTTKIDDLETRMTARIEERVEDTRSTIMAYLESHIEPQIRALAEAYLNHQESKASNERVDKLEEEMRTSRSLIMMMGEEIAELKRAK